VRCADVASSLVEDSSFFVLVDNAEHGGDLVHCLALVPEALQIRKEWDAAFLQSTHRARMIFAAFCFPPLLRGLGFRV
jgi:hypothetical protein